MTHAAIIALWPAAAMLARQIKVKPTRVRQWKKRNSIPPAFWEPITKTDRARRNDIDVAILASSYPRPAWGAA